MSIEFGLYRFKNILKRNDRSAVAVRNIFVGGGLKGCSIIISMIQVPLLIGYLDNTVYGIWLVLASIINWISYFDVGLTHGLRNRFAEAKALGDYALAKKYVSTTYALLTLIFGGLSLCLVATNLFLDWSSILKVSAEYDSELRLTFFILILTNCLTFILKVYPTILLADQRPALTYGIHTLGQVVSLLIILVLIQLEVVPLSVFALVIMGAPCLIMLAVTIYGFAKRYKKYAPSLPTVDFSLVNKIIGLGIKFFIIQIALLVIFQMTNIIISRNLGPESVTEYNVTYTYFSAFYLAFNIIITPYWSACTDAYVKGDMVWVKKVVRNLTRIWLISIIVMILMVLFSGLFFRLWIGNKVDISLPLCVGMAIYVLVMSLANIYMYIINGIGKVNIQMIVYCTVAVFSIPALVYACRALGLMGIVIVLTMVYLIQTIFSVIQLHKLLNNKATSLWNK